jgi:hypothetical protein
MDAPMVPWATLLARTFDVNIKSCARYAGRLEVRAVVTDPLVARKFLDAMPAAASAPPSTHASLVGEELAGRIPISYAPRRHARRRMRAALIRTPRSSARRAFA